MIPRGSTRRQAGRQLLICGLVLCGAMTACSDSASPTGPTGTPSTPSTPQVVDRSFTIGIGQSASVDQSLVVTFRRVVSDNRCPGDAICVAAMAGEAVLEFDIAQQQNGMGRETWTHLSTNPVRGSVRTQDYTVQLEQVMPYPFASLPPIKSEDWRATVRITSNPK